MELSRPVAMHHHVYLTMTMDFQGQILKMLYLRNGGGGGGGLTWNERGYLTHDLDPWFSRSKFKVIPQEWDARLTHVVNFNFDITHDLDLEFSMSNFEINVSQEWEDS